MLAQTLKEMQERLQQVAQEDYKRNWTNEGMAQMNQVLRKDTEKSEDWYFSVIASLVRYLNANQGGIFTLEQQGSQELYLELQSFLAYEKRKYAATISSIKTNERTRLLY